MGHSLSGSDDENTAFLLNQAGSMSFNHSYLPRGQQTLLQLITHYNDDTNDIKECACSWPECVSVFVSVCVFWYVCVSSILVSVCKCVCLV